MSLGGLQDCGSFEVDERDVTAHPFGNARGERGDLFMDAHEKGVGRPATLFANSVAVFAIECHGHGASSSERVAADESG